jgi:hypothetical protein
VSAKKKAKKKPLSKAEQLQRFKEAARASGADESGEKFEQAFEKIVPARTIRSPKSS